MAPYSDRLPHVVRRADLAMMLTPFYTAAVGVDDDEAGDRLSRALGDEALLDDVYASLWAALTASAGPRATDDALVDKLSKAVGARRSRVRAPASTPELSALLVRINLAIGEAPETMRAVMDSPKGRAAMERGLKAIGAHLVRELLK